MKAQEMDASTTVSVRQMVNTPKVMCMLDETVPVTDAHDIAAAARNASLHLGDGADHRFSNPLHMRPVMKLLAEFFGDLRK